MHRRTGFTLVELMVAMALTIFIMTILTQAFVLSIDTFVGLKGIGDMQDNLRAARNVIQFDLAQNHFEGARRASDPSIATQLPTSGFFRVFPGASSQLEGTDLDGMSSSRSVNTGASYVLQFTSRLKGNQQQSFYTAPVLDRTGTFFNLQTFYTMNPATTPGVDADVTLRSPPGGPFYRSQWAEIVYFLGNGALQQPYAPVGTTEEPLNPNGAGLPLYGLYRAQYVAVTDNTALNNAAYPVANQYPDFMNIACGPQTVNGKAQLYFYGPHDMAKAGGATRTFNPLAPVFGSASLVVPNVLSFQVQGIGSGSTVPADVIYDSASGTGPMLGVSITIRVWDNKTRQTRQMTIMQDL